MNRRALSVCAIVSGFEPNDSEPRLLWYAPELRDSEKENHCQSRREHNNVERKSIIRRKTDCCKSMR